MVKSIRLWHVCCQWDWSSCVGDDTSTQVNSKYGSGGHTVCRWVNASKPDTEGIDIVFALSLRGHVEAMVFQPRMVPLSSLETLTRSLCRDGLVPWWISSKLKDWPRVNEDVAVMLL